MFGQFRLQLIRAVVRSTQTSRARRHREQEPALLFAQAKTLQENPASSLISNRLSRVDLQRITVRCSPRKLGFYPECVISVIRLLETSAAPLNPPNVPNVTKPAATSHARPFSDLRDAHAPVQQPAHRHPVQPRSSIQAGAESVAAPLVYADARNVEVLTDLQPVNAGRDLAVLARLLDAWTDVGVPQRDAVFAALKLVYHCKEGLFTTFFLRY